MVVQATAAFKDDRVGKRIVSIIHQHPHSQQTRYNLPIIFLRVARPSWPSENSPSSIPSPIPSPTYRCTNVRLAQMGSNLSILENTSATLVELEIMQAAAPLHLLGKAASRNHIQRLVIDSTLEPSGGTNPPID